MRKRVEKKKKKKKERERLAKQKKQTSSRFAAIDTTLLDRLTSDATRGVEIVGAESFIRVAHPSHFARTSAVVRGRDIEARANAALLDQLGSEAASNLLQLRLRVVASVNAETTLATTEWHVHSSALVSHQGSKSHDFLLVDVGRVADTTLLADGQTAQMRKRKKKRGRNKRKTDLAWEAMVRVLSAVALDNLDLVLVLGARGSGLRGGKAKKNKIKKSVSGSGFSKNKKIEKNLNAPA